MSVERCVALPVSASVCQKISFPRALNSVAHPGNSLAGGQGGIDGRLDSGVEVPIHHGQLLGRQPPQPGVHGSGFRGLATGPKLLTPRVEKPLDISGLGFRV